MLAFSRITGEIKGQISTFFGCNDRLADALGICSPPQAPILWAPQTETPGLGRGPDGDRRPIKILGRQGPHDGEEHRGGAGLGRRLAQRRS